MDAKSDLKVCLIGNSGVGKTSILERAVSNLFKPETCPTVGYQNSRKEVIKDNTKYVFNIWDTAGQETFRSLVPVYFREASAILLVFDVTSKESFDDLQYWIETLIENDIFSNQIMLIGNKIDLQERAVELSEITKFQEDNRLFNYFECSALSGVNINEIFYALTSMPSIQRSNQYNQETVTLTPHNENNNNNKNCC